MNFPNRFITATTVWFCSGLLACGALSSTDSGAGTSTGLGVTEGSATPAPAPWASTTVGEPLMVTPDAILKEPGQVNLARWFAGTGLVVYDADGTPKTLGLRDTDQSPYSTLLGEDATASVPIGPGKFNLVLDLGHPQVITFLGFYNYSALGTVDVYYADTLRALSQTSDRWKSANVHASLTPSQAVSLNTEPLDARYLMLSFNINQIGEIGSLAIFGQTKRIVTAAAPGQPGINGVPATTNPNQKSMDFDYGPAAYGSHVTHVSGGNVADAQKAIDGDPNTAVQLGQNPGQDNIMVLDLGATREISKLGLLFSSPGPGAFEFYFMNDLPNSLKNANEGNSLAPASGGNATAPTNGGNTTAPAGSGMPKTAMWRQPNGTLRPLLLAADEGSLAEALALAQLGQADVQTAYLPPDFFQTHQPNVVEKVKGNEERITMKFDKVPMRYVIVRWIPDSTGPNANTECSIYELHIIGQTPESYYLAAMAVNQFSSAESASSSAGSTSGNGGTGTGTAGGTNVGPPPPIVTQ